MKKSHNIKLIVVMVMLLNIVMISSIAPVTVSAAGGTSWAKGAN